MRIATTHKQAKCTTPRLPPQRTVILSNELEEQVARIGEGAEVGGAMAGEEGVCKLHILATEKTPKQQLEATCAVSSPHSRERTEYSSQAQRTCSVQRRYT